MSDLPRLVERHLEALEAFFAAENNRDTYDFLTDGLNYQFDTGGKRLRPALCLIACEVLGGDPRAALPFAMACEVLHNFLLVHDDIEDGDTVRRDQQTLWAKFGIPNALNVADFMIAQAYSLIVDLPSDANGGSPDGGLDAEKRLRLARVFTHALSKTVEGQALDVNLRGDVEVDLATYYRLVTLKTGHYLALPWVGGAIVAGIQDDALPPLWELGVCLGPAFQIRDDVIDLTEGKGRGGEIGCDIREGKPSIFFAWTMDGRHGTDADRERLLDVMRADRESTSDADVEWVIDFYRREGALEFAQSEAKRLAAESEAVLDRLPFGGEGRDGFRDIIGFIVGRKF